MQSGELLRLFRYSICTCFMLNVFFISAANGINRYREIFMLPQRHCWRTSRLDRECYTI